MKILIIQPWLSYRGAESISIDEAHGLKTLGHTVAVLCLYVDKSRLRKKDLNLTFILPPSFISRFCQRSNMFFFLFGFIILLALFFFKGRKYDIYNPHNFPSPWAAVIVSAFYKKPVVWTVHNFPQHGFSNPWASRIWEGMIFYLDQSFTRKIAEIICVSEKVKKQVHKTYKRNSRVLYPPVDSLFFAQGSKNILSDFTIPQDSVMVLIPSKLHELKNLFLALRVVKSVVKKESKMLFVFAGEGSQLLKLNTYAEKLDIKKYIKFIGFVPKEQLRSLYKASRFIFLPGSYGEGFNIVVLEALCAGTPSVVLKGSGVDEWVLKNKIGYVVQANEGKIIDLFLKLKNDNSIHELISTRGKKIVEKYSPESYARSLIKEFYSLIEKK